jgi:hypothetical protein
MKNSTFVTGWLLLLLFHFINIKKVIMEINKLIEEAIKHLNAIINDNNDQVS